MKRRRACRESNSLGQTDRSAAAQPDRPGQQRIGRSLLGPCRQRRGAVFALVIAERMNHRRQLGIVVTQLVELIAVVAVNFFLDRCGAGHSR